MKIGFDAKRAFHNGTGLGNYSRTLLQSLMSQFQDEQYLLFNPQKSKIHFIPDHHAIEINPRNFLSRLFPSLWRSRWMVKEIAEGVDLFHGMSNELPYGIDKINIHKVVSIHDLIFEYYPEQYNFLDRIIYRRKFKYACKHADHIIAISESTKKDIINLYQVPAEKITVCYQSCDEKFFTCISEEHKHEILKKYKIEGPYFLSVGSIIERKNLLSTIEAFKALQSEHDCKLLVIGKGNGKYRNLVRNYIREHHLYEKIIFLEDLFPAEMIRKDIVGLYQNALALVYPSQMEGFGIPILEAMASGIAVITSNISSLPEVGGDIAISINPKNTNELYLAMKKVLLDPDFRMECGRRGMQRAQLFSTEKTGQCVMKVFKQLNNKI